MHRARHENCHLDIFNRGLAATLGALALIQVVSGSVVRWLPTPETPTLYLIGATTILLYVTALLASLAVRTAAGVWLILCMPAATALLTHLVPQPWA